MTEDKTFIRITNQHIYDEIIEIKNHVIKTNGKVKLNRWVASTALSITLTTVVGFIIILSRGL